MYSFEPIDLGEYRGDSYLLVGFVEPEPVEGEPYDPDEDAENYGVSLARITTHPLESNEEIVCMDTAHGRPHLDLRFLPPDADERDKIWLEDGYSCTRMKRYLLTNWQYFVDRDLHYSE